MQESDTDFSEDRGKVDQTERGEKEKVLLHVDTLWSFERERERERERTHCHSHTHSRSLFEWKKENREN